MGLLQTSNRAFWCLVPILLFLGSVSCNQIEEHTELFDASVQLTCSSHEVDPEVETEASYQWILPSGVVLGLQLPTTQNASSAVNASTDRLTVLDDGAQLQINKLDRQDFGLYTCLVFRYDNESGLVKISHVIRHGVNTDGPYYGDQMAKYKPHMKSGFLAGIAVFVITSLICCNIEHASVHYDRKLRRQQEARRNFERCNSSIQAVHYSNTAFVADDDIVKGDHNPFEEEVMTERPPTKL